MRGNGDASATAKVWAFWEPVAVLRSVVSAIVRHACGVVTALLGGFFGRLATDVAEAAHGLGRGRPVGGATGLADEIIASPADLVVPDGLAQGTDIERARQVGADAAEIGSGKLIGIVGRVDVAHHRLERLGADWFSSRIGIRPSVNLGQTERRVPSKPLAYVNAPVGWLLVETEESCAK